ncbi:MAG: (Fe-S)-binding protein [Gammaproteobacteria bacterium]|nr:(Fe-S)-binding protein [Gammaproteobacteria bacterium]
MIDISEAADRCVMCGMCLPHCPTYNQTRNEADSPRGRIALMRALHTGQLGDGDALVEHLDGCLACRACEPVCPANVPYGDLIDSTRATLRDRRSGTFDFSKFLIGMLVTRRWPRTLAYALLLAYQRSGVENMGRKTGLLTLAGLARGQSLLPVIEPAARPRPKSTADYGRPSVALFTGCVAEIFDRTTLNASQKLLTRLGYHVSIPKHQTCCGALHLHSGAREQALGLMKRNVRAFEKGADQTVISTASGCGAQLSEYAKHLACDSAQRFAKRHQDICQFLTTQAWPRQPAFRRLAAKVMVHTPCSLRHVLKKPRHALDLLARIPNIELQELPDSAGCCGAAGSYMLTQPRMADILLAEQLEHVRIRRPDIIATSNIGCALHIKGGLRRAGLDCEVLHPVTLLIRQLITD